MKKIIAIILGLAVLLCAAGAPFRAGETRALPPWTVAALDRMLAARRNEERLLIGNHRSPVLAALLENRTDTSFPATADVETQLLHLRKNLKSYRSHRVILDQLRSMLHAEPFSGDARLCGKLLLAAFPERLAKLRRKNGLAYILRNGRGATLVEGDILRGSEFLAVAELGGRGTGDAPILRAAPLTREELQNKLDILEEALKTQSNRRVKEALRQVVPTYHAPEEVNGKLENR